MTDLKGNSEFRFPSTLNDPLGFTLGNIQSRGDKTDCFPRWGQSLSNKWLRLGVSKSGRLGHGQCKMATRFPGLAKPPLKFLQK